MTKPMINMVERLMNLADTYRHSHDNDRAKERKVLHDELQKLIVDVGGASKCNPHPKAPHGFDRNASHSAHRYVCECESWEPYAAGFNDGFQAGMKAEQTLYELANINWPEQKGPMP